MFVDTVACLRKGTRKAFFRKADESVLCRAHWRSLCVLSPQRSPPGGTIRIVPALCIRRSSQMSSNLTHLATRPWQTLGATTLRQCVKKPFSSYALCISLKPAPLDVLALISIGVFEHNRQEHGHGYGCQAIELPLKSSAACCPLQNYNSCNFCSGHLLRLVTCVHSEGILG
jgi:hypothetical protein